MADLEDAERALRAGVLLQARDDLGALRVTGRDAKSWLNGLVTCDVKPVAPGRGAYGLAVGKTGRILAELWVVAAGDGLIVASDRARMAELMQHFDRHLIMEDA